jgi:hypothetical protein
MKPRAAAFVVGLIPTRDGRQGVLAGTDDLK